jgi:Transglutaminase-like enzymes, putative cysteine proteases
MKFQSQSKNITDYLRRTDIIDFDDSGIAELAGHFRIASDSETELIRRTYEFVRDEIFHSADIDGQVVTCKASDVLDKKEGICFAKSHLLAALLRANGIPSGFCYQRLRMNDEADSPHVLHGLNAIFAKESGRWVRLDARGNKEGIDARFSLCEEYLAFPTRPELGEFDTTIIYADPVNEVVEALTRWKTFTELWANLPDHIEKM